MEIINHLKSFCLSFLVFPLFFSLLGGASLAFAKPTQVILIRHGEKISDDHRDLSPQGCQRAYQLPFFLNKAFLDIAAVYAVQPHKAGSSIRSLETVAPFADQNNLKIKNKFTRNETEELAEEILEKYQGKTILVAWERKGIPDIAEALGLELTDRLEKWPDWVYDQAWVLSISPSGNASIKIAAEYVLPKDISPSQSGVRNWGKKFPERENEITVPLSIVKKCQRGNQSLDALVERLTTHAVPSL